MTVIKLGYVDDAGDTYGITYSSKPGEETTVTIHGKTTSDTPDAEYQGAQVQMTLKAFTLLTSAPVSDACQVEINGRAVEDREGDIKGVHVG
jgi:hypothetical protein